MPAGFIEQQFPPKISRGATGGPNFNTQVIISGGGWEQRNIRWAFPLASYNISTDLKQPADFAALTAFIRGVAFGRAFGWRFKDWADYTATGQSTVGVVDGTNHVFALQKVYNFAGLTFTRPIKKPVAGTVVMYDNGAVVNPLNYSVATATGLVTFTAAPLAGHVITSDFQFDVPARFDSDYLSSSWDTQTLLRMSNVAVMEIRV
jgi:uncharacterized protein (TIGR02217 family)